MKPKNQKVWTNDHYGLDHQALEYLELILREKNKFFWELFETLPLRLNSHLKGRYLEFKV